MGQIVIIVTALSSSLAMIAISLRQKRILPGDISLRTRRLLELNVSPDISNALAKGDRITAIKAYREEHHVGLREGKEQIDRLERVLRST